MYIGYFSSWMIIAFLVLLASWIVAAYMFIDLAKQKDPQFNKEGRLYFVTLVASPFVTGLYVCAMPDKRQGRLRPVENHSNPDESRPIPPVA